MEPKTTRRLPEWLRRAAVWAIRQANERALERERRLIAAGRHTEARELHEKQRAATAHLNQTGVFAPDTLEYSEENFLP